MSIFRAKIIEDWQSVYPTLVDEAPALNARLSALFQDQSIPIHTIQARVKSTQSLTQKLSRPDRTYQELWDITDLLGFRVVTPYEDSIDDLARVIEKNLVVDLNRSLNKLRFHDHERFGYRSLHYICEFPPSTEGTRHFPTSARFEIQLRTALQNVWAEIEHGLGYKADEVASLHLRRRFSRISSLFEIADEELVEIKKELNQYIASRRPDEDPRLDHVTLNLLVKRAEVNELDQKISHHLGKKISEQTFFPDYTLRALSAAHLETIHQTLESLSENAKYLDQFMLLYFAFAKAELGFDVNALEEVQSGYSLLFLAHLHLLKNESLAVNRVQRFAKFYENLDFQDDPEKAKRVASKFVKAMEILEV